MKCNNDLGTRVQLDQDCLGEGSLERSLHFLNSPACTHRISTILSLNLEETYLSPLARFFLSFPLKAAKQTSTTTVAPSWLLFPPTLGSMGPVTVHIIFVLPHSTYEEPSAAVVVDSLASKRRSSFQRRPSIRSPSGESSSWRDWGGLC